MSVLSVAVLHSTVTPATGQRRRHLPAQIAFDVYAAKTLVRLGLGGVLITLASAFPAAVWAARLSRTAAFCVIEAVTEARPHTSTVPDPPLLDG